ncbi:hypothetical protein ACSFCW_22915 [Yokenella regensburgei]|uniref:hypothetical protein n=1 Tax=Yokenella regensburgei TaxID=158877 RepID=UPI003EDA4B91
MITGFGNNVISSLAADITAGQTSIQVMPGTGAKFAGLLSSDYANASNPLQTYAKITLTDAKETVFEICHLTSVNNDVLTVVRGQEGTTAKGWALNDVIANFATRGSENQFVQIEQLQSGHYISGVAGGTANALTLDLPATYFVNGATDWTLRTPIVVYPTQNNTGASTLQLTMGGRVLGTFKLYKGNKAELVASDILKDTGLVCLLDNTKTFFNVMNPGAIYAGLGSAAFHDVQTSQDDVTPGRVLVNGGALALRTVAASGGGGAYTDDCNNLPANSVSFVYSSAKNSPGFEASVLDFSGLGGAYRTQIASSYSDGGKRVSIRTCNGDNQTWNAWKPILTADGGSFPTTFAFTRIETIPTEQNMSALFNLTGGAGTIVSGTEYNWYSDKITTGITRGDSDRAWGYAIRLNGNDLLTIDTVGNTKALGNVISGGGIMGLQGDDRRHFVINNADGSTRLYIYKDKGGDGIHFSNGVDGGGDFIMGKSGEFQSPSHLHAGGAALNVNGDVYGDVWGGWLSTQLSGRVTSSRRGPQQYINPGENGIWFGFEVPNGYFSGTRNHTDDGNAKFNEYYYRIQQIYIPAQGWVDTGTA